ncbi:MAG: hypothetical protein C0200_04730 [Thermoproteota archaeon]|nr:MAG: hypothetical protein C0200_04730 [Candidatus Korarchaeota archaeon]
MSSRKIIVVSTPFMFGFISGFYGGRFSLSDPRMDLCMPLPFLLFKILEINSLFNLKIMLSSLLFWIPVPYYLFIGYTYGLLIRFSYLVTDPFYLPALISYSIPEVAGYIIASYVSLDIAEKFYRFIRGLDKKLRESQSS